MRFPSWITASVRRAPLGLIAGCGWTAAGGTALIGNQALEAIASQPWWFWPVWWTTLVAGTVLFARGVIGIVGYFGQRSWLVGSMVRHRGIPRIRIEWGPSTKSSPARQHPAGLSEDGAPAAMDSMTEDDPVRLTNTLRDDLASFHSMALDQGAWDGDSHWFRGKYAELMGRAEALVRDHWPAYEPDLRAARAEHPSAHLLHESASRNFVIDHVRTLLRQITDAQKGAPPTKPPKAEWPPALRFVPSAGRVVRVGEFRTSRSGVIAAGKNLRSRLWSYTRYQLDKRKGSLETQEAAFMEAVRHHKQNWWSQGEPGEFDLVATPEPVDPRAEPLWQAEMSARIDAELQWLREHHEPGRPD